MYRIFDVPPEHRKRIDEVLKDDAVSRQSITIRAGDALGLRDRGTLVILEGDPAVLARAAELFGDAAKALEGDAAEDAYRRFKDQEDDVASGVGMIFGG